MLNDKTKYTSKFQVYTGNVVGCVEKLLGERVVNDLVTGLNGKNHILYIDNYFTSYHLFQSLKKNIYLPVVQLEAVENTSQICCQIKV